MSAFNSLAASIIALAEADTGSGGLYNASAPLVTGVFTLAAPTGQPTPYVVLECVAETETKTFQVTSSYVVQYLLQFSIYAEKEYSGQGLGIVTSISTRLRTVYDGTAPVVSGWTTSRMLRSGSTPPQIVDRTVFQADEYEIALSV